LEGGLQKLLWGAFEAAMKPIKITDFSEENVNKILGSLPTTSRHWVETLELVGLPVGTILHEADRKIDYVYFLNNVLVSIVSTNSQGGTVEISLVGHEGMVGVPAILGDVTPFHAVVQMSGSAFRIGSETLYEELRRNPILRDLLLKYTNAFITQIAQSTICNCYHTLQERLCRWLLIASDAIRSDVLVLTHDVIARLLGTRRASVTVTAGLLQRAGLIRINRGQITILDSEGLKSMSCECYGIVHDGIRRVQAA
jgi:CRP-like cAMP-binding protein